MTRDVGGGGDDDEDNISVFTNRKFACELFLQACKHTHTRVDFALICNHETPNEYTTWLTSLMHHAYVYIFHINHTMGFVGAAKCIRGISGGRESAVFIWILICRTECARKHTR